MESVAAITSPQRDGVAAITTTATTSTSPSTSHKRTNNIGKYASNVVVLASATGVLGGVIGTSHGSLPSADSDDTPVSPVHGLVGEAEATLSLLQVDDEYDYSQKPTTHQWLMGGGNGSAINTNGARYCHYHVPQRHHQSMSGSEVSPSRTANGGGRRHSGDVSSSVGTFGDSRRGRATTADVASPSIVQQRDVLGHTLTTGAESSLTSPHHHVHHRTSSSDQLTAEDDGIGWRLDFEEEEARERLEKAMRDQQRYRQEELYELQRVYAKAVKKNFRSLRRIPEPSFDTPTALYEEELDALEEHCKAALQSSEGADRPCSNNSAYDMLPTPPSAPNGPITSPRAAPPHVPSNSIIAVGMHGRTDTSSSDMMLSPQHHVDCADSDAIDGVAGGGGTHIHTTHGGGTYGDGGVFIGGSSFVSRLRRRTTTENVPQHMNGFRGAVGGWGNDDDEEEEEEEEE